MFHEEGLAAQLQGRNFKGSSTYRYQLEVFQLRVSLANPMAGWMLHPIALSRNTWLALAFCGFPSVLLLDEILKRQTCFMKYLQSLPSHPSVLEVAPGRLHSSERQRIQHRTGRGHCRSHHFCLHVYVPGCQGSVVLGSLCGKALSRGWI